MKKALILSILVFNSCGKDESGSTESPNVIVQNPDEQTSYYVNSVEELKKCEKALRGSLAYIRATDQFMACTDPNLTFEWVPVNVKGKDGSNGKDGKDMTTDRTFWTDPFTGKLWHLGGSVTQAQYQCQPGYAAPSDAIYAEAAANGLTAAILAVYGTGIGTWTLYTGGGYTYYVKGVVFSTWSQASYGALRVCYKQ